MSGASEFTNAEQWVSHNLRRWILDGVLKADQEINQQDIANRLGVSRSPVRDALRRLEGLGLVTINPNQRAVVTSLTLGNMREIFEMRAALEALAALHATDRISDSDLIELESLAQVMTRLKQLEGYLAKHEAFHDLVAQRAGMPRLRRELIRLRTMATPYIRIYGNERASAELRGDRHEDLVEVLRARDPEKAASAFSRHARTSFEQLAAAVSHLQEEPQERAAAATGGPPFWAEGSASLQNSERTTTGAGR